MEKISTAKVAVVLEQVPTALRGMAAEIRELREKTAAQAKVIDGYELDKRVHRIASQMDEKGYEPELSLDEKIASLKQKRGQLDVIEEAVKMAGKASDLSLASLSDDVSSSALTSKERFNNFLLEGVDS